MTIFKKMTVEPEKSKFFKKFLLHNMQNYFLHRSLGTVFCLMKKNFSIFFTYLKNFEKNFFSVDKKLYSDSDAENSSAYYAKKIFWKTLIFRALQLFSWKSSFFDLSTSRVCISRFSKALLYPKIGPESSFKMQHSCLKTFLKALQNMSWKHRWKKVQANSENVTFFD